MRAVGVGDNCIDVYERLGKEYPGGNAVNFAIYAKKLGMDSSYVGAVGTDRYGRLMIDAIGAKGVDISHVQIIDGKTATTQVELVGNDRVFVGDDPGVSHELEMNDETIEFITGHNLVHSCIWGRVDPYFAAFRKAGLITSYDFANQLQSKRIAGLLPYVDYAFFSYQEHDSYIEEFVRRTYAGGCKVVIVTLGANGSIAFDGTHLYRQGSVPVEVVDTLGAGDAFITGFMLGIAHQGGIQEALAMGAKHASEVITYFGAW